jgi:Imidazolonepropionase and related amidohydrolases
MSQLTPESGASHNLVLLAGQLLDGNGGAKTDVAVRIEGERIAAIGARSDDTLTTDATVIDLSGSTLMPGMIDAHMHFFGVPSDASNTMRFETLPYRAFRAAGEAKRMLDAGITSARCLGSAVGPDMRRVMREGLIPGPRLEVSGDFICSTAGTWDHFNVPMEWVAKQGIIADGPDECRKMVRTRIRQGATVIKIGVSKGALGHRFRPWGEDPYNEAPGFSLAEIQAVTDEAHLNGLEVSAHCIGDPQVQLALDGGVDIIEHGFGITDATRDRLAAEGKWVVTTLSHPYLHHAAADEFGYPAWKKEAFARHVDAISSDFAKGLEAGVKYALGSDNIGWPTHPQGAMALEFELAERWGMTASEAIVAGTRSGAQLMRTDHLVGTVEVGKLADIIALGGDPLSDITLLRAPQMVMQGGEVVIPHTGGTSTR